MIFRQLKQSSLSVLSFVAVAFVATQSLGGCASSARNSSLAATFAGSRAPATEAHDGASAVGTDGSEEPAAGANECYQKDFAPNYSVARVLDEVERSDSLTASELTAQRMKLRVLLLPYFGGRVSEETDIYEVSKESPAFRRAISFLLGRTDDRNGAVSAEDYRYGARMTALLAATMATANQPECAREFRGKAQSYLGKFAGEYNALPFVQAADAAAGTRIDSLFQDAANDYRRGTSARSRLDAAIKIKSAKDRAADAAVRKARATELGALRKALLPIEGCANALALGSFATGTGDDDNPVVASAVRPCREAITAELAKISANDEKLVAKATGKDAAKTGGDEKARDASNAQLKANQARTTLLTGALELLAKPNDSASVLEQYEQLRAINGNPPDAQVAQKFSAEISQRSNLQSSVGRAAASVLTSGSAKQEGKVPPALLPYLRAVMGRR